MRSREAMSQKGEPVATMTEFEPTTYARFNIDCPECCGTWTIEDDEFDNGPIKPRFCPGCGIKVVQE